MITALTKAQEAALPEYAEQWTRIGLSCEPTVVKDCQPWVEAMYRAGGLAPPQWYFLANSPWEALFYPVVIRYMLGAISPKQVRNKVQGQVGDQVRGQVRDQVQDQVADQVRDQVRGQVWRQVWNQAWDQVRDQVRRQVGRQVVDQVRSQVMDQVQEQVWRQVGDKVQGQVWSQVGDQVRGQVGQEELSRINYSHCFGPHSGAWLASIMFFRDHCGLVQETEPLVGYAELAKRCGWFLPYKEFIVLQHRHSILQRNARGQLHCTDGQACGYPDGWGVYALNGVRMEEWMVMTPAEGIDPSRVLTTENVEQRRELIRKIGVERFVQGSGAGSLDRQGDYELLSVDLSKDIRDARFLKMKNPSIGVYHIEGVHPSCNTVQEAINWRASGDPQVPWHPTILT